MAVRAQVEALRGTAGVAPRPEVRTLKVTGPDRLRFLDGMLSNDVASLNTGEGLLAVKTTNRGRIEGFMRVRATDDAVLLDLLESVADKVRKILDMYIIMDDCMIVDVSAERDVLTMLGPDSAGVLGRAGMSVDTLADHAFVELDGVSIIRDRTLGLAGYELHLPAGQAQSRIELFVESGAHPVAAEALDVVRVESGVPIDGRDLADDTIPLEARLEHAISFDKGCYVGQEVIARAHIQGQVNHLLVGLTVDGDTAPPEDVPLIDPERDKAIGEVTSVVASPSAGLIALGYVHRKYEAVGTELVARHEGGEWKMKVAALPFV